MVLFPFSPGNIGPIKSFEFVEILAPIILSVLIFDYFQSKRKIVFSTATKTFITAIGLIVLWSIISYIRNPAPYKTLFGGVGGTGGVRAYYAIFVCCTVFFAHLRLFAYEEINLDLLLKVLVTASLTIGFLRIFGYFLEFDLPLGGAFKYAGEPGTKFGGKDIHRIGGIDWCIQVGLSALFGSIYQKRKTFLLFPLLFLFFILAFFGGGRMMFVSLLLVISFYFSFFNRKKTFIVIMVTVCFLLTYNFLNQRVEIPQQFDRLLLIKSSNENDPRSELFSNYFKTFINNPLLGKGITFFTEEDKDDFVKCNLAIGGHNAYLSSLAIFGIAGAVFLVILLFGTIFLCISLIKRSSNFHYQQFAVFLLVMSVIQFFCNFVGGTGYQDILLYFMGGASLGTYTKNLVNPEE